ncbi:hypothetical protein ABPG74_013599 [Tetrahymena malaccensis]
MNQYLNKLKTFLFQDNPVSREISKQAVAVCRIHRINAQTTFNIQRVLNKAAKHKNAAVALVISADSSSYAQAYNIVKQIQIFQKNTKIPVYTFGEEQVFSGGYLVLCAGQKSFVDNTSLVGNLGVNYTHTNIEKLVTKTLDFTINDFHTSDIAFSHRADSLSKPKEDNEEFFRQFNSHLQDQVIQTFETLRKPKVKLQPEQYQNDLLQGEIYSGKKAVEYGLVDEIGTYYSVIKKEFPNCKVVDITRASTKDIFGNMLELFWLNIKTMPFNVLVRYINKNQQ